MGNGSQVIAGPASISLYESKKDFQTPGMLLPATALRITNLFPNESVEFFVRRSSSGGASVASGVFQREQYRPIAS
jgi:hypothetical protein